MKQRHAIAIALCGLLVMDSCTKDPSGDMAGVPEGSIQLTTEGYQHSNENKTSVSGHTVQWVNEDRVKLNGTNYVVYVNGSGKAYVKGSTLQNNEVYGWSPYNLGGTSWDGTNRRLTLTFPSSYTCSYVGGRQKIDLPMAVYTSSAGETLQFKHLSAAVKVKVKNEISGKKLVIDSVVVSSTYYKLCGSVTVTLADNADPVISAQEGGNSVSVVFTDFPTIAYNSVQEVQVPILPIGASGQMTVKVYTHEEGTKCHQYNYSKTVDAIAVGRNVLITAGCLINITEGHYATEVKHRFTVGSGTQVYFSQGNLQYVGTWQFAENQFSYINKQENNSRDLFGWGTKNYPNNVSTTNSDYSWAEWGENAITNGGNEVNSGWRTLRKGEWDTLFNIRSASTIGGTANARFAKAYLPSGSSLQNHGIILFPDNYTHPIGVATPVGINKKDNTSWNDNAYSESDWKKMEAAGVVFLPAVGKRSGSANATDRYLRGYYWSSSSYNSNTACYLEFYDSKVNTTNHIDYYLGYSVRLVKDAN